MMGNVPIGVSAVVLIVSVVGSGAPALGVTVEGWNMQAAPAGKPLQDKVTGALNTPSAVTWKLMGSEVLETFTTTPAGAGALRSQSITCRASETLRLVGGVSWPSPRSEEHTSELQSHSELVCRLLLEKKKHRAKHRTGTAPNQ